jgi:hypothetical protein
MDATKLRAWKRLATMTIGVLRPIWKGSQHSMSGYVPSTGTEKGLLRGENMKARKMIEHQIDVMEDSDLVVVMKRNGWVDAVETVRANSEEVEATALDGIRRHNRGKERVIKLRYPAELESALVRALTIALSIETKQRSYNGEK